jgi:hypothetical protein
MLGAKSYRQYLITAQLLVEYRPSSTEYPTPESAPGETPSKSVEGVDVTSLEMKVPRHFPWRPVEQTRLSRRCLEDYVAFHLTLLCL